MYDPFTVFRIKKKKGGKNQEIETTMLFDSLKIPRLFVTAAFELFGWRLNSLRKRRLFFNYFTNTVTFHLFLPILQYYAFVIT